MVSVSLFRTAVFPRLWERSFALKTPFPGGVREAGPGSGNVGLFCGTAGTHGIDTPAMVDANNQLHVTEQSWDGCPQSELGRLQLTLKNSESPQAGGLSVRPWASRNLSSEEQWALTIHTAVESLKAVVPHSQLACN